MNYESKYKIGEYISVHLENNDYTGMITKVSFTIQEEFYDILLNWDGQLYKDIHVSYISEIQGQRLLGLTNDPGLPENNHTGGPVVPETYTT